MDSASVHHIRRANDVVVSETASAGCTVYTWRGRYTLCPEKRPKCFFVTSSTKLGRFWWSLVRSFCWIHLLQNHVNVSHLTWIVSLHYLVKFKMFIVHVLPLSCYRNSRIYPILAVVSKFSIFESTWLWRVRNTAKKAYNMRYWSGPIDVNGELLPQFVASFSQG